MSCIDCDETPIRGACYRWKNANVEIVACVKHWKEIVEVLEKENKADYSESKSIGKGKGGK